MTILKSDSPPASNRNELRASEPVDEGTLRGPTPHRHRYSVGRAP